MAGASASVAIGWAPSRSIVAEISTTASSGRFAIAPSLRRFTTCTSPVPAWSEATSAAAASL